MLNRKLLEKQARILRAISHPVRIALLDLLQEKKDSSDNIMIIDESVQTTDDLEHNQDIFKKLNIKRYCCKRHLLGHVDILHKL